MKRFVSKVLVAVTVAVAWPVAVWAGQVVSGSVTLGAAFQENVNALVPYQIPASISAGTSYANGTASTQVDTIYAKALTLAGATQTLDLTNLVDPSGATINFARVREFVVQNTATTAGYDVKVEAGASNGWSVLPPSTSPIYARYGASIKISDPNSTGGGNGNVVGGTSKNVTFDPGANTITINVLIVGGSAA